MLYLRWFNNRNWKFWR